MRPFLTAQFLGGFKLYLVNDKNGLTSIPGIRPYFELIESDMKEIFDLLTSGQVTNNGCQVQMFEKELAAYLGVRETVAVSNGSDALLISLRIISKPGHKVILPAYTYVATLNAVVHSGMEPVFCDIEPGSFTMDPTHLSELLKIHGRVTCVIPVNVFGIPPDLARIRSLCDKMGATLLYDNAHGFGTVDHGLRVRPEAQVQTFSFHATKVLPAVEGGLIVSENPHIMEQSRNMRNHGLAPNENDTRSGINSKLDEIRASIGKHSLEHFADTLSRRRQYGYRLLQSFNKFPDIYTPQVIPKQIETNFQNLCVCCPIALDIGLTEILNRFQSRGVGVRSYFNPPMYRFPEFRSHPVLPKTDSVWRSLICFPLHSRMEESVLCRLEETIEEVALQINAMMEV